MISDGAGGPTVACEHAVWVSPLNWLIHYVEVLLINLRLPANLLDEMLLKKKEVPVQRICLSLVRLDFLS